MSIEPYIAGHPSADERQRLWHVRLQVFGVPEQVWVIPYDKKMKLWLWKLKWHAPWNPPWRCLDSILVSQYPRSIETMLALCTRWRCHFSPGESGYLSLRQTCLSSGSVLQTSSVLKHYLYLVFIVQAENDFRDREEQPSAPIDSAAQYFVPSVGYSKATWFHPSYVHR